MSSMQSFSKFSGKKSSQLCMPRPQGRCFQFSVNTGISIFNQHLPAGRRLKQNGGLGAIPGVCSWPGGARWGAAGSGSGLASRHQPPVAGADLVKDGFQEVEPQNQAGSLVSCLAFHFQ